MGLGHFFNHLDLFWGCACLMGAVSTYWSTGYILLADPLAENP